MNMKVALMQPTFMPWMGYFELMSKADKFVILDDFQFEYRSFGHRNRLFTNINQINWYTVPVIKKDAYLKSYLEAKINENGVWRRKMWRSIEDNYRKASFWAMYSEYLKKYIVEEQTILATQNISIIKLVHKLLNLDCEILYSSQLDVKGYRSEHVKNILEAVNADCYLCANGSFEYMLKDGVFPLKNIEVKFQNANLKRYEQVRSKGEFVPYLSIFDALFNVGANKTRELVDNTTDYWLSWEEMLNLIKYPCNNFS